MGIGRFGTAMLALLLSATLTQAESSDQSLASAANDPTAPLMAFMFQDYYAPNHHNSDQDSNFLQFRAAIPFELWGTNHLARLSLPYFTDTVAGTSGLGDATLFDLMVWDQDWGRWGVGAVANVPLGNDAVSSGKWALGPAVGFAATPDWGVWGLFNQNLFTLGGDDDKPDVNIAMLQPFLTYNLGNDWSIGTSEMNIIYDLDQSRFAALPLGVKLSKLVSSGRIPVQYSMSYERNFADHGVGPENTLNFGIKLLVPK